MIVYTPPAATSGATTALLPYDWAARPHGLDAAEWVQGGTPDLDAWTDATDHGGTIGVTTSLALANKAIKIMPALGDMSGGYKGQGILKAAVAGDFVYAARFGLQGRSNIKVNTFANAVLCFVDANGATPHVQIHRWYGGGVSYANFSYEAHALCAPRGTMVGVAWDSMETPAASNSTWWRSTLVDVFLQRVGTDLTVWACPAGELPRRVYQHTGLSAGAGLVGFRTNCDNVTQNPVFVTAFARLAAVPGV